MRNKSLSLFFIYNRAIDKFKHLNRVSDVALSLGVNEIVPLCLIIPKTLKLFLYALGSLCEIFIGLDGILYYLIYGTECHQYAQPWSD